MNVTYGRLAVLGTAVEFYIVNGSGIGAVGNAFDLKYIVRLQFDV